MIEFKKGNLYPITNPLNGGEFFYVYLGHLGFDMEGENRHNFWNIKEKKSVVCLEGTLKCFFYIKCVNSKSK